MWSRRILRAGWLIAPIFTFPAKVWNKIKSVIRYMCFDYSDRFSWFNTLSILTLATVIISLLFMFRSMIETNSRYWSLADNAEIKEAAKNECVAYQLDQKLKSNAIRIHDIDTAIDSCNEAAAILAQRKALEK